jgi:flagellar biosynthesis chaperone FliJ
MKLTEVREIIRQVIAEAKAEGGLPKSGGKLVHLKKELAGLKNMKESLGQLQIAEGGEQQFVAEYAHMQKFVTELEKIKAAHAKLAEMLDKQISEVETKVSSETEKIKEMVGLIEKAPKAPKKDAKKAPAKKDDKKAEKKEEPKADDSKKKGKELAEELDTKKVYGGIAQNQGSTGSSLQFTISENTPEYFEIDFILTPNSKNRPAGAGSRSPREKEYGYAKIPKKDFNGSITVKGENFNIGKDFITNNL